jgi:hypothetical protein
MYLLHLKTAHLYTASYNDSCFEKFVLLQISSTQKLQNVTCKFFTTVKRGYKSLIT